MPPPTKPNHGYKRDVTSMVAKDSARQWLVPSKTANLSRRASSCRCVGQQIHRK